MIYKKGFTLAEVLITLGVIGVVAAVTMPTLLNKINMIHFKAILKEDYSIMQQAHLQIKQENGEFKDGLEYCAQNNNVCLKNAFKKKLKNVKDCDTNEISAKCFPSQSSVKFLNGNPASSTYLNNDISSGIILSNGSSIVFWNDSPDCSFSSLEGTRCGWLNIDVNGIKGPNTWGKDIYHFDVNNHKITPCCNDTTLHYKDDYFDCETTGIGCAAKYLLNQ